MERRKKGKIERMKENRRQARNSMKKSGSSTSRNTFRVYTKSQWLLALRSISQVPCNVSLRWGWGERVKLRKQTFPYLPYTSEYLPSPPRPPSPPQGRIKLNWSPSQRPEFSRRPSQTECRIATNFTSGEFAVTTTLNYKQSAHLSVRLLRTTVSLHVFFALGLAVLAPSLYVLIQHGKWINFIHLHLKFCVMRAGQWKMVVVCIFFMIWLSSASNYYFQQ